MKSGSSSMPVTAATQPAGLSTEGAALAIAFVMLASLAALGLIWFALGVVLR